LPAAFQAAFCCERSAMKAVEVAGSGLAAKHPSLPYVAPFAVFVAFLALERFFPVDIELLYPIRVIVVLAVILVFSRSALDFQIKNTLGSLALGVAVFIVWVAPDVLWPAYRSHWLFTNPITGEVRSSMPSGIQTNLLFIVFRFVGCSLLVPILEELFWRGWLARWLIDGHDFRRVPLGAYTAMSFWTVPCCSPPSTARTGKWA